MRCLRCRDDLSPAFSDRKARKFPFCLRFCGMRRRGAQRRCPRRCDSEASNQRQCGPARQTDESWRRGIDYATSSLQAGAAEEMTKMLASVTGLAEAEIAIAGGADIVDLKDPTAGALGAVATETIRQVVTSVAGRCATSAVCGDLPMVPEAIRVKVEEIAATGVDYVKIGFFACPECSRLRRGARAACLADQADCRPVCRSIAGFRIAAGAGQTWLSRRDGRHGRQVERAAARPFAAGAHPGFRRCRQGIRS